jgi:glucose/arabinose dehydrogenase
VKNIIYLVLSQLLLGEKKGYRSGNQGKRGFERGNNKGKDTRQIPVGEPVIIADNLEVPWSMAVSETGRIYFTERPGRIRLIENGILQEEPLYVFDPPFTTFGESGLMGIVLDPNHSQNGYLYVMHSYVDGPEILNRVVRLVEEDGEVYMDHILIDEIPGSRIHNGGRIKIGPDGKLYITTGDAGISTLAQNPSNLAGKILRLELDGSIPVDNPDPNSPIYSLGHRNPQGLTWNNEGTLFASEHGQIAYDEINIIFPGGNYGWPLVEGYEVSEQVDTIPPLLSSLETTWAPSGMTFVRGGPWDGKLLVANLRGEQVLAIDLDESQTQVENVERWFPNVYGRIRDVVQAPDGSIYIATNNTDGRGTPRSNDDKILRIIP